MDLEVQNSKFKKEIEQLKKQTGDVPALERQKTELQTKLNHHINEASK